MLGAHGGSHFLVGYSGSRRMIGVRLAKQVDEVIPDAWRWNLKAESLGWILGVGGTPVRSAAGGNLLGST